MASTYTAKNLGETTIRLQGKTLATCGVHETYRKWAERYGSTCGVAEVSESRFSVPVSEPKTGSLYEPIFCEDMGSRTVLVLLVLGQSSTV